MIPREDVQGSLDLQGCVVSGKFLSISEPSLHIVFQKMRTLLLSVEERETVKSCGGLNSSPPKMSTSQCLEPVNMLPYIQKGPGR